MLHTTEEVYATILLNIVGGVGPSRYQSLVQKFGSAKGAVQAGLAAWAELTCFDQTSLKKIEDEFDTARRQADEDLKVVQDQRVNVFLWQDEDYPPLLRQVHAAPPIIYVKGNGSWSGRPAVALVGSRRCSYYGEKMAKEISKELTEAGVVTVSGLARGVDSHVHRSALEVDGETWAVIGSGLAVVYPPENRELADRISDQGMIISEFPMSTMPFPANFPRRNRVIAGLSVATVVIEGTNKSGSLITARLAAEEGRDVFALPGPVTSPLSAAPHRLIQMGAKLIERTQDILDELPEEYKTLLRPSVSGVGNTKTGPEFSAEYKQILSLLDEWPCPKDQLAQKLKKAPSELSRILLEMELQGLIGSLPGGMLIKR